MYLGIDFGTCFSAVALSIGSTIMDGTGEDTVGIPTLFLYDSDSNVNRVGKDCKGNMYAIKNSDSVVRYIKTLVRTEPEKLDDPSAIYSGGKYFSQRDVVKNILTFLIEKGKEFSKGVVKDSTLEGVCITAPAAVGTSLMLSTEYRAMLIDVICEITGLNESRITVLPEPVAAAIHYLHESDVENQSVLVFDLGGGTLDVTVITYSCENKIPRYSIERIDGDAELGGNAYDEALSRYVLTNVYDLDPDTVQFSDPMEKYTFDEAVTKLKIDLSSMPWGMGTFSVNGDMRPARITESEFDDITKDLTSRAMTVTQRMVNSCDGGIRSINKIVLVGGGSNMPLIRRAIETTFPEFPKENILVHEPSKAISKGAALFTTFKSGGVAPYVFDPVVENSYGWGAMNSGVIPAKEMIYNILMKETKFATGESKVSVDTDSAFHAIENNQTKVVFVVYESNVRVDDCIDGHWVDFGAGQKTCGIEVTIPVPTEYIGRACEYNLFPRLVLDKNGILRLEVYDTDGNLLGAEQNAIHGSNRRLMRS